MDDSQLQNTIVLRHYASAAARNLDTAIPLRSAETELQNAIELQHTTVEHIADAPVLMHKAPQHMQTTKALPPTTHRFDAPVPMHKVSQHMQNTKAQQQQRREKVTWNSGTLSYNARAVRDKFDGKFTTPENIAQASQLFSAEKTQCFVQILTFKVHP